MVWRWLLPWLAGCGLYWSHDHAPGAVPPDADQPVDTGGTTDRLHDVREQHTAVRLGDGRVLVTGGEDLAGILATTELYNGSWAVAESMHQPRVDHALVALSDGTVLVAGGYKQLDGIPTATAELFDPLTGHWTTTQPMLVPRTDFGMVRLASGRVLATGGRTVGGGLTTTAASEEYDPNSHAWTTSGAMTTPRVEHATIALPDGRVLVIGGFTDGNVLASTEIYDPHTRTWRPAAPLPVATSALLAVVLATGKVLVVGGGDGNHPYATATLYDPVADRWSQMPSMSVPRLLAVAVVLANGRVLVMGGESSQEPPEILASTEVFDPITATWSPGPTLHTPRASFAATRVDDKVLVSGGYTGGTPVLTDTIEMIDATAQ